MKRKTSFRSNFVFAHVAPQTQQNSFFGPPNAQHIKTPKKHSSCCVFDSFFFLGIAAYYYYGRFQITIMVICASGATLCKQQDEDILDNLLCNQCEQPVHRGCAQLADDVGENTYLCLQCIERKRRVNDDPGIDVEPPTKRFKSEDEEKTHEDRYDGHVIDVEAPTKRLKSDDEEKTPDDDYAPIPVETSANNDVAANPVDDHDPSTPAGPAVDDPMAMTTTEPIPLSEPLPATGSTDTQVIATPLVTGVDTGRDIFIKQEQFPVPLLDIDCFMNLPESYKKISKRYLDEPHPTLKTPISPFNEGKGSFSTGWWLAFHHYNRDLPEYAGIRKDIICCNLCGAQVKRGERARATSALVQHLKTKIHRAVFDQLAILWEGKARDPLVPRINTTPPKEKKKEEGASQQHPRKSVSAKDSNTSRVKKSEVRAQKEQNRAITHWIADTNLPMDVVEHDSFRRLVEVLQSTARFEVKTTANDVSQEITILDEEIKQKNREAMKGRIVWTTQGYGGTETNQGYRFLTAHFINKWFEVDALMLEAKEHVVDPNTHNMANDYLESAGVWEMKPGLVYKVEDDQISNPGFVSSTDLSSSTMGAQLEKNKGMLNVSFVDQNLSSTAELALDFKFAEEGDSAPGTRHVVTKARELVAIFKQSSERLAALKKIQGELPGEYKGKEPLDIFEYTEEFWWTLYEMADRLLKLRPALEKLWQENRELDSNKMLDIAEWDVLKQLLLVLKPLIMGVKALESEKTVAAPIALVALNMVRGELANIQTISEEGGDHDALVFAPNISNCAKELLEHFDKTWGSLEEPFQGTKIRAGGRNRQKGLHWSILMAYVLDPRFKALPHIPNEKNQEAIWEAVTREMAQVKKQHAETDHDSNPNKEGEAGHDGEPKDNAMLMYMMNSASKTGEIDQEVKDTCEKELASYKASASPPLYDASAGVPTNPLSWWKANHDQYPTLWSMAQVFLAIPVSAAFLEKKFGKTGPSGGANTAVIERAKERMNIRYNTATGEASKDVPNYQFKSGVVSESADI